MDLRDLKKTERRRERNNFTRRICGRKLSPAWEIAVWIGIKKGKGIGGEGRQSIRTLGAQGRPGKEDTEINIKTEKAQAKLLNLYLKFLATCLPISEHINMPFSGGAGWSAHPTFCQAPPPLAPFFLNRSYLHKIRVALSPSKAHFEHSHHSGIDGMHLGFHPERLVFAKHLRQADNIKEKTLEAKINGESRSEGERVKQPLHPHFFN